MFHPCDAAGAKPAFTGLTGQATEDAACTARSEDCLGGLNGCGANQYQFEKQVKCPHSDKKCSICANCPSGRHKGAGCTSAGIEACCASSESSLVLS